MITIRKYQITDRYKLEELINYFYDENRVTPPTSDSILSTIGFFSGFSQCGSIYMLEYKEQVIGYAIVVNVWSNRYGKISYLIDELYIMKNYRKFKIEVNLLEYLVKHDGVYGIGIRLEKIKSVSVKIMKLLKFNEDKDKLYTRVLIN